jgi:hypothetical protein
MTATFLASLQETPPDFPEPARIDSAQCGSIVARSQLHAPPEGRLLAAKRLDAAQRCAKSVHQI